MSRGTNVCNGPLITGMYNVKPYYDNSTPLELPQCMYTLNSIYCKEATVKTQTEATEQSIAASVKALEERQERILSRLHQLQLKVKKIVDEDVSKSVLQTSHLTALEASSHSSSRDVISDVVISASPTSPPLSVFILYEMLAQQKRVLLHSFVHSSVRNLAIPNVNAAFNCLVAPVANRSHFQLGLSIIWKDVRQGATLVVSPSKQTPVVGEVNVARYLARLLTPRYDADVVTATQIDALLDHAAVLLHSSDSLGAAVKSLGQLLGRKKWFVGNDRPSVVDIVMWSAVKQRNVAASAPENVRQWLARCDLLPEFAKAERLLVV